MRKSDKNLMNVSNLGVCFGPTLLRPEEETVASILDLKFYNIVVEILIDNYEKIFSNKPDVSPKSMNHAKPTNLNESNNSVIYSTPNNHIPAFTSVEDRIYANNGQANKLNSNSRNYLPGYTCVSKEQKVY